MIGLLISDIIIFIANAATLLLCARAILSWFSQNPYSQQYKYYMVVARITEPIVKPCRKLLSRFNTGGIDFSVMLAMLIIQVVSTLIIRVLTYSLYF